MSDDPIEKTISLEDAIKEAAKELERLLNLAPKQMFAKIEKTEKPRGFFVEPVFVITITSTHPVQIYP